MLVLNFYAGPGAGKSTTAAHIFSKLKNLNIRAEMAREVAKDLIWEGREVQLHRNQFLVSAMQYARLKDLKAADADVAVSDCPLLLGLVYGKDSHYHRELSDIIRRVNQEFVNINIWVKRVKPYQQFGRLQGEAAAIKLDQEMMRIGKPFSFSAAGSAAGQDRLFERLKELPAIQALIRRRNGS